MRRKMSPKLATQTQEFCVRAGLPGTYLCGRYWTLGELRQAAGPPAFPLPPWTAAGFARLKDLTAAGIKTLEDDCFTY